MPRDDRAGPVEPYTPVSGQRTTTYVPGARDHELAAAVPTDELDARKS
ncbi:MULTISPECIES: hypothetical protein [Streptomyces]|uniref:Uncharacterized protein n=1 Tax=Streptomyces andamanensis TaxID=1565035 RepID=A0ABV8TNN2_9ACTN|nr:MULTISPECIES: hypothetical protein [unclassified Streptomyces]MYR64240.1 hypothetical protein [Streptomyces sp. SID625]